MQRDSPRHHTRYAIFNGLTFSEYLSKREHEIAFNTPIQIYSEYRYLSDYSYGNGLKMIVDAPALNVDVIEAAIRDFRRRGESEWQSDLAPWRAQHTNHLRSYSLDPVSAHDRIPVPSEEKG